MTRRKRVRLLLSSGMLLVAVLSQSLLCSAVRDGINSISSCRSDCSWTSYEASSGIEKSFQCSITSSQTSFTCPLPVTTRPSSVDERPKPVENLKMEFYAVNLTDRDAVNIEDYGGVIQQICLKVNFTLDPSTAKNIEAISLSLYSANYQSHVAMLCQLFHFSTNLTYCSVLDGLCNYDNKRVFVSDCMCDLIPAGSYRLTVRTHPEDQLTNSPYDTDVSNWFNVPDCLMYPLDHHCPRGLRVWRPRYSMSHQQPDYTSMTTCFSLPPEDAATFDIFLYDVETYQPVKDKNLTRSSVIKMAEVSEGELHELACIKFQGLSTNKTYLPALRLNDGGEPLNLQYLKDAELFLLENPCKSRPCGDSADGVCVSNLSKHECICNEAAIFDGKTCRRDVDDPVVINCPPSFEVPTSAGNCSAHVEWTDVIAEDNSGRVYLLQQSHQTNQEFNIGDTVVKYEFGDRADNRAVCMFIVSVIDSTPPVFESCPETIEGRLGEGETHAAVTWNVIATDNCVQVHSNIASLQSRPFPRGKSEVSVNAWDATGNNRTCSITVIIRAAPFNFLRWLIICSIILLLVVAIISILWRYRGKLKAFKAFLKSHQPYSLSAEGSLPGPLATTACKTPSNGERVGNWLAQDVTSIPDTLSQEDVVSTHLKFEPVTLISGERTPMMKVDGSRSTSPEGESKDYSVESDCLVGSVDFSRSDSEVGSTFL